MDPKSSQGQILKIKLGDSRTVYFLRPIIIKDFETSENPTELNFEYVGPAKIKYESNNPKNPFPVVIIFPIDIQMVQDEEAYSRWTLTPAEVELLLNSKFVQIVNEDENDE